MLRTPKTALLMVFTASALLLGGTMLSPAALAQSESFAIESEAAVPSADVAPVDTDAAAGAQTGEAEAEATAESTGEPAAEAEAPVVAADPENNAAKFELAKEILKLAPIDEPINKTIEDLSQKVPATKRILFKSIVNRSIKIDRMNAAAELAFVELFTKEELTAMRDYYKSAEGKSIRSKMTQFDARMQPVIQAMLEDALYNIQNSKIDFSRQ